MTMLLSFVLSVYMRSNRNIFKGTLPLFFIHTALSVSQVSLKEGSSLMVGFEFLDTAPTQRRNHL